MGTMSLRRSTAALLGTGIALGLAATASSASAGTAAGVARPETAPPRGTVVSADRVARMSAGEVRRYLAGDDPALARPGPRFGVDTYRVVYRTVTPQGTPATAAGVVTLPAGHGGVRAVSFAHGTHLARNIAGSVDAEGQSRVAATFYAGAGYAGVAPDYLGLGLGPGPHPYMHAATEAAASLDLLRAARRVASSHRRRLERGVLVTGFSQGGHAAMALGRELQRGADPYLRPAALAPVSGPFDLRDAQLPASLDEDGGLDPKASVFYLSYLFVSWNRLFHLYDSPSEVFRAPYDTSVPALFDGRHADEDVITRLPARVRDLLTPRYVHWLLHPTGPMARALRSADGTCQWRPRVPVRLFAAAGDEQVAFANTTSCLRELRARGARPSVTDYGMGTGHFRSMYRGIPDTLRWFGTLE
ncbi:lipase [Actinomadura graeca]|uniref:Lipase n=1 Tax=Actinomadura graeca TaxID=2750812 RepID=A0ABX8QU00_9ACTN|nr:hypothetical protein [Actinomadura graeca]QXJ22217.1 lipase [Actinomadura graeca]